jgi:hypothetical protein
MGAYATGTPIVPLGLVAGTLSLATGGAVYNLIDLIVAQLDVNVNRGANNVVIQAGAAALFIGTASTLGGALSATNYGLTLATGVIYTFGPSNFPGANAPLANLQVLSVATGSCHVMVW